MSMTLQIRGDGHHPRMFICKSGWEYYQKDFYADTSITGYTYGDYLHGHTIFHSELNHVYFSLTTITNNVTLPRAERSQYSYEVNDGKK